MNNNQTEPMQYSEPPSDMVVKPGTLLRQKREAMRLSQQEVADKLRLRVTLIQSIEDNNFDIDKVKTFTRGYVRSYARLVGIEESTILASYDLHYGTTPQDVDMKSFSKRTKREQHNSRINYLTFGIVLTVIGISSVWWYQNQTKDTLLLEPTVTDNTASTQVPDEAQDDSFTIASDLVANENEVSSLIETQDTTLPEVAITTDNSLPEAIVDNVEVDSANDTASVLDETAVADGIVEPQSTQDTNSLEPIISMNFNADCWIQVKDASGKTLSVGLKKAGQVLSLDGVAPFSVILGAPENVSITFASEPVDLSRYTSGKVARFTLSR